MAEFDDRQIQIDAENEPYHPYDYQTEENGSWAGNLPVKQGLYDPDLEKDAWYVLPTECGDCSKAALATPSPYQANNADIDNLQWCRLCMVISDPAIVQLHRETDIRYSHIKGKASHKIVSDGMPQPFVLSGCF